MAPSGHETPSGAGHRDSQEISPSYSTRSSKRKASEISSSEFYSSAPKPTSQDSRKTADDPDTNPPPPKKTRRSAQSSPESAELEAAIQNSTDIPDIPDVKINSPAESGIDDAVQSPPRLSKGGFRGRARGRGRGRGGRGRGRGASYAIASATPAPEVAAASPSKRYRGRGGRVKQSDNARIQALYDRKADLKAHHKRVAQLQRAALDAVAEKSLDLLKSDPDAHKKSSEYDAVIRSLDERLQKTISDVDARTEMHSDHQKSWLHIMQNSEERMYQAKINAIMNETVTWIKQHTLFILRQAAEGGTVEDTLFFRGAEGKIVKRIAPPTKIVHQTGTPYFKGFHEDPNIPPLVKGGYEVGPGDWWRSLTAQERKDWTTQERKAAAETNKKGKKGPKKSALFGAVAIGNGIAEVDDASAVATPGETSDREPEEEESETQSDAEEQPTDKLGVYLPKKPIPRNGEAPQNRFVLDPPVTFESDEIGVREHHTKRNNKNELSYVGMDAQPNPKKLHLDQVARGHNSAKNRPEDLDQHAVKAFGVHPTYGLPLKTSKNPDKKQCKIPAFKDPTDWTEPLRATEPTVFIEEPQGPQNLLDFEKKFYYTSRSVWMMQVDREWEQYNSKQKMAAALESIHAREPRPVRKVASIEKPKKPEVIDASLLDAVSKAATQAKKPQPVVVSSPARMQPSPRSYGYDPVRDTGYESRPSTYGSPYTSTFHRAGTNLAALADAAELRGSMAPPSAFRINRPWVSTPTTVGISAPPPHSQALPPAPMPILPHPSPIQLHTGIVQQRVSSTQPQRPSHNPTTIIYLDPPATQNTLPQPHLYPRPQMMHSQQTHPVHHPAPLVPQSYQTRFHAYSHPPPAPHYHPPQRHAPNHMIAGPSGGYRELRPAPPQNRGPPPPPPPQPPPPQQQQPPYQSPPRWYRY